MKRILLISMLQLFIINGYAQTAGDNLPVKEGPTGVYIFVGMNTADAGKAGNIYRSIGDNRNYKLIGTAGPVKSEADFRRIAGNGALKDLARLKKLNDEHAAFVYATTHGDIKDYGVAGFNIRFMNAIGICFLDGEAAVQPRGTKIYYKVEYTGKNAPGKIETSLVTGIPPVLEKPVFESISETDSGMVVKWIASAAKSTDAFFGQVYRQKGNAGAFEHVGNVFAQKDSKQQTISYKWFDKVKPHINYRYFLLPVTYTEMPGEASDTVVAISNDFKNMQPLSIRKVRDTSSGVFFSWDAIKDPRWYSGIIIERSKNPKTGYDVIDTVDVHNTFYTDTRVLPNTIYHYRISLISIRGIAGNSSADVVGFHNNRDFIPDRPANVVVKINGSNGTARITWDSSAIPFISGYYVYRADGGKDNWQLLSNKLKTNAFTDTLVRNASGDYKYNVRAVTYSEIMSLPSEIVFTHWINNTPPGILPIAFTGYAETGRCILSWRDVRSAEPGLTGYNVYRKKGKAPGKEVNTVADITKDGFEKINIAPVTSANYIDEHVEGGVIYTYLATVVNINNIEGRPGPWVVIDVPAIQLMMPAQVSVRKISSGIIIDWGKTIQNGVEGYEILRRKQGEEEPVVIAKVSASENSFIDKTVGKGQLYFYTVRTIGKGIASKNAVEKGVRL